MWRREWDSNPRPLAGSPVFKTGSLNHSDISPYTRALPKRKSYLNIIIPSCQLFLAKPGAPFCGAPGNKSLRQQNAVVIQFLACTRLKATKQIFHGQSFPLLTRDVQDNIAVGHH